MQQEPVQRSMPACTQSSLGPRPIRALLGRSLPWGTCYALETTPPHFCIMPIYLTISTSILPVLILLSVNQNLS